MIYDLKKMYLYIYTIFDLFCENGFHRAISHQRRSVRCNEMSVSSKTFQRLYVYQGFGNVTPL